MRSCIDIVSAMLKVILIPPGTFINVQSRPAMLGNKEVLELFRCTMGERGHAPADGDGGDAETSPKPWRAVWH